MRAWLITIVAAVLGAAAGYLYYAQVGCASGSCAITSSPVNSTLYGALLGGLLGNSLGPRRSAPGGASGQGAEHGDGAA